jgi:ribokinase
MGADRLATLAGGGRVLLTLGAKGALLIGPDGATPIAPPPVNVVDTVGAGDTLNGALAAGIAAGLPIAEAARRAVVAASLAVTRAGARGGMPTAAELETAVAAAPTASG